jgi:unsaturated rhamnogalacturonyl hydrolase
MTKGRDSHNSIQKLRAVADSVLKSATFRFVDKKTKRRYGSASDAPPDAELKLESPHNDWRYWNGVLDVAMLRLGRALHDPAYSDFATKNIAFNFESRGYFEKRYRGQKKWSYPFGQLIAMEELDDCGAMGAAVIEVSQLDGQDRYSEYIDRASAHVRTRQSRLKDGTFVRAFPHKWTLWADDLYMGVSFLSRMGEMTGDAGYFDDAANQVAHFHKYLFNERMELMHHCWYSDVNRPGVALWGRANGWALLAQADLLDRLPENHPKLDALRVLLQRHILGVSRYQGGEGLWHQLLDKPDSYLETSCSAMFTYAIARSVNKGNIESRYASIAERGWEGVMSRIRADGKVEGVCTGTAVSDDLVHYYRRPAPLNDSHGLGVVLLAGAEATALSST